ncbi:DUF721 domain-containing protein [Candidatus Uhrbacteria bacterium]|nr:DUF721 domain-containing protein [Candidatus Uhrbacteria bacterium]
MSLNPIGRIQSESLAKYAGLRRNVDAVRVLEAARVALEGLWGKEKAAHVRPATFRDGELKLVSSASIVVGELKRDEVRICNEVNRMLGGKIVRSLSLMKG